MDLKDQRVVVMGGTSGIGLAVAETAAAAGAQVTIASSKQSSVDSALGHLPSGTAGKAADLTNPEAVDSLFDSLGEIDHVVYTAGDPLVIMKVEDLDLETAKKAFNVRFFGALSAAHAAAPKLRSNGSITLTTGVAKERPDAGWAVAAGVCGAVESLTRALAVELAPIRVNSVSPGVVRSPLWSGMGETEREQFYRHMGESIPAGRVGEVQDIARAYVYCMTEPFATGTVMTVDGGAVLV